MADHNQQQTFTLADVVKLVTESNAALVAEMRKPSALDQQKLDRERAERQRAARMRLATAKEDERTIADRIRRCAHKKINGDSAWGGQVNSDGYARLICLECGMIAPEVKAPLEWVTSGINAQDPQNAFMKSLTLDHIKKWQEATGGPKPIVRPRGTEPLTPAEEAKIAAIL